MATIHSSEYVISRDQARAPALTATLIDSVSEATYAEMARCSPKTLRRVSLVLRGIYVCEWAPGIYALLLRSFDV